MIHLLADAAGTTAAVGGGLFFIVFLGIVLITSAFVIWMLIDAIVSPLPAMEKLVWVLVILFLHLIGALLYYFIGRPGSSNRMASGSTSTV